MARTGYTLPVFAVAAAKAAFLHLLIQSEEFVKGKLAADTLSSNKNTAKNTVVIYLVPGNAEILIQQVASLDADTALGICLSDPGDNLDLTRNTPIWAWVCLTKLDADVENNLILEAGEGVGRNTAGEPAFYAYARKLFEVNIRPLIPTDYQAKVRIILPEGQQLAQRTSNEAFGILQGLALLGTGGISQPHSSTDQLENYRVSLQKAVLNTPHLVFCIGHNGLRTAHQLGIGSQHIVQTGNWIGAMLAEAGIRSAESILLLGYHGKLIKLAGGIFNTSSHVADGKLAIMAAAIAQLPPTPESTFDHDHLTLIRKVLASPTAAAAQQILINAKLADPVFELLAQQISDRAQAYIQKYADVEVKVGTMLCDRQGNIIGQNISIPSYFLKD